MLVRQEREPIAYATILSIFLRGQLPPGISHNEAANQPDLPFTWRSGTPGPSSPARSP